MIIYQITLPKEQNIETFIAFMQEKYFPAIHRGPTRTGQVTSLALLKGREMNTAHRFFWHIGWSGLSTGRPRIDSQDVQNRFKAFNASLKCLGVYEEVTVLQNSAGSGIGR